MKRFIQFLLLFFFILGSEGRACVKCSEGITVNAVDHQRLKSKAHEAKAYCVSKGFSTNYCFLVDFSIHSGKKSVSLFGILKEIPLSMQVFVPMAMGKTVHLLNLFLAIHREVFALLWENTK